MPIDSLISISLSLIMFSVGTSISLGDFWEDLQKPKAIIFGLVLQICLLPILAFLVLQASPMDDTFKLGIMILALCPGGATSNFISYLLNLKTALSVTLTLFNSLIILVTIPMGVSFFGGYFGGEIDQFQLSFFDTLKDLFFLIIFPIILGLAFRQMVPSLVEKHKKLLKYFSTILLAIIFAVKIFGDEEKGGSGLVLTEIFQILPFLLILHIAGMCLSYWWSNLLKISKKKSITIAIEVGLQNTTLALLITSVYLASNELSKPALVYAMFSFFTTFLFGYLTKKRLTK